MSKRPRKDSNAVSPHKGQVILFFDLGSRKGATFDPKIFYQMTIEKYEHFKEQLKDNGDGPYFFSYGYEYPVYKDNIKLAISYDLEPKKYLKAFDFVTNELGQKMKTSGLCYCSSSSE